MGEDLQVAVEDGRAWQAVELLRTVFYREQRAYLVGRLVARDASAPLVLALTIAGKQARPVAPGERATPAPP